MLPLTKHLPDVAMLDQNAGVVDRLGQTLLENLFWGDQTRQKAKHRQLSCWTYNIINSNARRD